MTSSIKKKWKCILASLGHPHMQPMTSALMSSSLSVVCLWCTDDSSPFLSFSYCSFWSSASLPMCHVWLCEVSNDSGESMTLTLCLGAELQDFQPGLWISLVS